jgi:hypothetical protein
MGTASFTVGQYARNRGTGAGIVMSSTVRTSGAYATSTSASNLEDAGGDITMASGELLEIYADEAMRVRFGGVAATATTGFLIPAEETRWYECNDPGLVSIIDVA